MKNKTYLEFLFLIILGGLTSLSLPPYNYLLINFITIGLFFIYIFQKKKSLTKKKYSFIYGWLFGFGYFITNLYWISISLTFDESYKFLIPITIFLIPSFLAIFYGLISYFFIILKSKKIVKGIKNLKLSSKVNEIDIQ